MKRIVLRSSLFSGNFYTELHYDKRKIKKCLRKILVDMSEYPINIQSFSLEYNSHFNSKYLTVLLDVGCYKILWDYMFSNEDLSKYNKKAKVYQQTTIVML